MKFKVEVIETLTRVAVAEIQANSEQEARDKALGDEVAFVVNPLSESIVARDIWDTIPSMAMDNPNLDTALCDLVDAIRGATLGSVEHVVVFAAGEALVRNWNDHNSDDPINEERELANWVDK